MHRMLLVPIEICWNKRLLFIFFIYFTWLRSWIRQWGGGEVAILYPPPPIREFFFFASFSLVIWHLRCFFRCKLFLLKQNIFLILTQPSWDGYLLLYSLKSGIRSTMVLLPGWLDGDVLSPGGLEGDVQREVPDEPRQPVVTLSCHLDRYTATKFGLMYSRKRISQTHSQISFLYFQSHSWYSVRNY